MPLAFPTPHLKRLGRGASTDPLAPPHPISVLFNSPDKADAQAPVARIPHKSPRFLRTIV